MNVNEGFSQGCPASPVFATIVLQDILSTIQPELESQPAQSKLNNGGGDDGYGSLGFILTYIDDVNCMLHHEDVEFFLQ